MSISTVFPLASAVGCLFLIAVILFNQQSRVRNIFLVALCLATIRSFSSFMLHSNFFPEQAIIWYCTLTLSLSSIIVVYYVFVRAWANKPAGWIAYLGYGMVGVLFILCISGIYVQDVYIKDRFLHVEENKVIFYAIELFGLFYCIELFYELIRRYRSLTEPAAVNQANYLLLGFSIGIALGFSNAIPAVRGYPVDQLGTMMFCIVITYAIVKHHLLNLKVFFRQMVFVFFLAFLFLIIFTIWLTPIYIYSGYTLSFSSAFLTALLTVITVSVFWQKVSIFLQKQVNRIFYGSSYPYRMELLNFVNSKVPVVSSLGEFGRELLLPLSKALSCKQINLLLPDAGSGNYIAEYSLPNRSDDRGFEIRKDSPLARVLLQKNQYLSRESIIANPVFLSLWSDERKALDDYCVKLLFPLISRGNLIGILSMCDKYSGNYSLDDINLVEMVTSQVATSLEKEYLQEQLRNSEHELALINRLGNVITSSLNIQDVYDDFVTGLRDVVDIDWATIIWIEEDKIQFEALSTAVGSAWKPGEQIPLKNTAIEKVAKNKKALVESDLAQENRFSTGEEFIKLGIRSIVYLPLLVKGRVIGSLIIASRRPDAFYPEQIGLLERLANQIAISVENSRLYTIAEQRARIDYLTKLFNRRHFDECLRQEVNLKSRYGGMLSVVLLDLDFFKDFNDKHGHPEGDKILSTIGAVIVESLRSGDIAFRYGGDEFAVLLREAAAKEAYLVAERIRERIDDAMWEKQTGITASLGIASWPSDGVTPDEIIMAADRALYYAKRTGGDRTCAVSDMLAVSDEREVPVERSEKENLNMIYALAATIEARDPYTYGHSRNVRRYSVALAEALGLPSENVAVISTASLLHDIGKIGIPDKLLNKTGELTEREWELVKTHPELSAAIVGHVISLTPCLPAILHHHERWDGSGYPSGLKHEAIPLEARILAISDSFEAMTSTRPYRGVMQVAEALEEIKRGSGKQFDPRLVETFLQIAPHLFQ